MPAAIMQMYRTEKVDVTEYYISELNHYMKAIRSTIVQCVQDIGDKYEVWKSPCPSQSEYECAISCTPCQILSIFRSFLTIEWSQGEKYVFYHEKYIDWIDFFYLKNSHINKNQ